MPRTEQQFRRLVFLQVMLGMLAFCIAEGRPLLLMLVGLLSVAAWFITETGKDRGLSRVFQNAGALGAVALVLLEYRATGGSSPVALVGHLTIALQLLLLFGKRGRREYTQLAVLSPLQMISASVLPGGVTLIYALLLAAYCLVTLMAAVASQVKRAGDLVYDRHKRSAQGMEGAQATRPDPAVGAFHRLHLRTATVAIGLACALTAAVVFLTTPRTDRSQLGATLTRPAAQRQAGFSKTVALDGGSIGNGSPEPVLNFTIAGPDGSPRSGSTEWLMRGVALDLYTPADRTWSRSLQQSRHDVTLHKADQGVTLAGSTAGVTVRSEVTLRRLAEQTVFMPVPADGPVAVAWLRTPGLERLAFGTLDQQIAAASPMSSIHTYTMRTWVADAPPVAEAYGELIRNRRSRSVDRRNRSRQYPPPRADAGPEPAGDLGGALLDWHVEPEAFGRLARRVLSTQGLATRLDDAGPEARLAAGRALAEHLRTQYRYTTDNPPAGRRDPVAEFLFQNRAGHCELFASALCALCRTVGIPARVVTGFRASEYNDIGGYYIVRQSHAHAWIEIDLGDNAGWHTLDATPAAEVDRAHQAGTGWFAGVREVYDHLEFHWIGTVITYDEFTQERMLGGLGAIVTEGPDRWAEAAGDWVDNQVNDFEVDTVGYLSMGLIVAALIVALVSLGRLLILRHKRMVALQLTALPRAQRRGLAKQLRFYIAMLEALERHGYLRPHWQSPYRFAQELAGEDPMRFDPVVALTELFYEVRFGYRHLDDDRRARIKAHLRHLDHTLAAAGKA